MDEIDAQAGEPNPDATSPSPGPPGEAADGDDAAPPGGAPEDDTLLRESPDPPITE